MTIQVELMQFATETNIAVREKKALARHAGSSRARALSPSFSLFLSLFLPLSLPLSLFLSSLPRYFYILPRTHSTRTRTRTRTSTRTRTLFAPLSLSLARSPSLEHVA